MVKPSKRAPRPIPNPHEIYQHASNFLVAINLIGANTNDENVGTLTYPKMTLTAFTSELLLKCLIIIEGKDPGENIHRLDILFGMLSKAQQNRLILRTC